MCRKFEYGSLQELIAISAFNRERSKDFLKAVIPAVGPEQLSKLVKSYRSIVFPEEKYDDMAYVKKAQEMFEKLRHVNLRVMPLGGNQRRKNFAN